MAIEIIGITSHPSGELYSIKIHKRTVNILLLRHATERMKKWKISDKMVLETLLMPEEVLVGHGNRYLAHRRYGDHLVRAVYEYHEELPVLVTVYFPYVDRYFKGGKIYEDKILAGS
jgi:hypothetical protein